MAAAESLKTSFLEKHGGDVNISSKVEEYTQEAKKLGYLAGPMVAVNLSQYSLLIISVMMVGHCGELYLSSTAIGCSFCAVTGFSLLFGMSTAMDTLSGQAFGAKQFRKVGLQTQSATLCLLLVCIPISVLWIYIGTIFKLIGQDPMISYEAGRFSVWLIPALFGYAILKTLVKYFQVQSLIKPLIVSSCTTVCVHLIICWVLVLNLELANIGAALAIGMSYWLNVILLGLYMKYSSSWEKTRVPLSMEIFHEVGQFFRLAIPSAFMICLEWWAFEMLTLLSGLLPNPKLEASVLSVCLSTITTLFTIPDGLGAAASTRISNELGAGNPRAARVSVHALMVLTVLETLILSAILLATQNYYGYIFSNEKEVVEYVTTMTPWICLCVIVNGLQGAFSGVARGCGWQDLGAYVNLAAYYLCGIPLAAILGFWLELKGKGLWIGILSGAFVQTLLLCLVTCLQSWDKLATKARERIFERTASVDNLLN